jgi:hypothetical protein
MDLPLSDLAPAVAAPDIGIPPHQQALLTHTQRRSRGVPTVSVFTGDGPAAYGAWLDTLGPARAQLAWSTESEEMLLDAWLTILCRDGDLPRRVVHYLSQVTNEEEGSILLRIRTGTRHTLGAYWQNLVLPRSLRWIWPVLQHLQERANAGADRADNWPQRIGRLLADTCDRPAEAHSLFLPICPPEELPAIWIAAHRSTDLRSNDELVRKIVPLAVDIAEAAPWLPIAIWAETEIMAEYWRCAPESHAKAILREGNVPPIDPQSAELAQPDSGHTAEAGADAPNDGARSWSERFLFAQLQSRAQTAGLFCLNVMVGDSSRGRAMEIDLLCRKYAIAVELDGYHHFQDPDSYRRDRKKDYEMQKLGIMVLRFLSDDVVSHLDQILSTIEDTIAFQRARVRQSDEAGEASANAGGAEGLT